MHDGSEHNADFRTSGKIRKGWEDLRRVGNFKFLCLCGELCIYLWDWRFIGSGGLEDYDPDLGLWSGGSVGNLHSVPWVETKRKDRNMKYKMKKEKKNNVN